MGFDIYAKNRHHEEAGGYFRASVDGWPPLWGFIAELCKDILTPGEVEDGFTNNGYDDETNYISAQKALLISGKLAEALMDKEKYRPLIEKHMGTKSKFGAWLDKNMAGSGWESLKSPSIVSFGENPMIYEDQRGPADKLWGGITEFEEFCRGASDGFFIR